MIASALLPSVQQRHTAPFPPFARSMLRLSLRRLHLKQQQGGAARWVLYDSRSGEEAAQDDAAAALLAGPAVDGHGTAVSAAPAGSAGSPQGLQPAGQVEQPEQQQRVWVGILGGPPPPPPGESQQHPARSPSKFLTSGASPGPRSPGPLKVLVT